jgi:ribosome maturation factor RimP
MDWEKWEGKKVFLRTDKDKVFSGIVKEVADIGDGIIFISLIDRFGLWITVPVSKIAELKEEAEKNGQP